MRSRVFTVCVFLMLLVGTTATLLAGGQSQPAAEADVEIVWMMQDRPEQPVRADSTTIEEIYRKTGVRVKMEGIPASDWNQVWQTLLATDDMADMMMTGFNAARDFYDTGSILAISDYFDQMPDLAKLVEEEPEVRKFYLEGKLYHLPKLWRWNFRNGELPVIRMDIVEELGLEAPTTFEELYRVLKAMKEAYPSSYPYTARGLNPLLSVSYALGVPHRLDWDPDIEGGKWVYGSAREEFYVVLEWLNRLFREGILDPDYASIGGPQWQERLGSGQSFFYFDNANFSNNMNLVIERSEGVSGAFQLLPTLVNYDGRQRNRMYNRHHLSSGSIISSKVSNLDRVLDFANWLYTDEGADITNFGIRDVDYSVVNGEYIVAPHHVEARKGDSDPWRSHMSYMASGLIQLGHWVDQGTLFSFIDDAAAQLYIDIENDPYLDERVNPPPLTPEEIRRVTEIQGRLNTLNDENVIRFINGDIPLTRSRFNQFREELMSAGVRELEEIYNNAEERVKG